MRPTQGISWSSGRGGPGRLYKEDGGHGSNLTGIHLWTASGGWGVPELSDLMKN